jgi:hypothetical protein
MFIDFARSPERAGIFESTFWHRQVRIAFASMRRTVTNELLRQVVLAAFNYKSVFHIATAIGALNEHIASVSATNGGHESTGLAFALSQCQKSMGMLRSTSGGEIDPSEYCKGCCPRVILIGSGVALVTCVSRPRMTPSPFFRSPSTRSFSHASRRYTATPTKHSHIQDTVGDYSRPAKAWLQPVGALALSILTSYDLYWAVSRYTLDHYRARQGRKTSRGKRHHCLR